MRRRVSDSRGLGANVLPNTPLLVAPSMADDPLGAGLYHTDLIKGLRRLCPSLCIPDPTTWEGWYPGKEFGMTSIWLGYPQAPGSLKVCSFHLGWIPEFTQTTPNGILRRGWRSVLWKICNMRIVSKFSLEREFKVNLDYDGKDKVCPSCQEDGIKEKSNHPSGLCDNHEAARENLIRHHERKAQERELVKWAIS